MISGRFVFTIWFKTIPGGGAPQPNRVTEVTIKNGEVTTTVVETPTTVTETVTTNPNDGTGSTIRDKDEDINPFNIPVPVKNTTNPVDPSTIIFNNSTSTTIVIQKTNTTKSNVDSFDAVKGNRTADEILANITNNKNTTSFWNTEVEVKVDPKINTQVVITYQDDLDVVDTDPEPEIKKTSVLDSSGLMWVLIAIICFAVLLLCPILVCWGVPCCCPNSMLALWIFVQKEKMKDYQT